MLVEVMLLRRAGIKLTRAEVFSLPAHRGYLSARTRFADPWRPPWEPGTSTQAFLGRRVDYEARCLLHLRDCHLSRWRGTEFVLVGLEGRKGAHYGGKPYPQAWWCRMLQGPAADTRPATAPSPGAAPAAPGRAPDPALALLQTLQTR